MLLSLDNLAHRYHCLPSEALMRANTFDLRVLDISGRWARYQQDKSQGKTPITKMPSQEQMLTMLKNARGQK